jgi:FdhD protein
MPASNDKQHYLRGIASRARAYEADVARVYAMLLSMNSKKFPGTRLTKSEATPVEDLLPIEAVLQLKVNGAAYTTTVRTPGADEALARGLLYTEGVLVDPAVTPAYHTIPDPDTGLTGCLEITVPEASLAKDVTGRRSSMGSASCGLCGIREPEELLMLGLPIVSPTERRITFNTIALLMEALPDHQPLFQATGGVHGAMAFAPDGRILSHHEDIGRHNAVDKCIGDLLNQGRLNDTCGVVVSGRMSYEIVFKAYQARWPYLLSVSAPSSLAVEMGEAFGLCIIGFCRGGRATVYSHRELVESIRDARISQP